MAVAIAARASQMIRLHLGTHGLTTEAGGWLDTIQMLARAPDETAVQVLRNQFLLQSEKVANGRDVDAIGEDKQGLDTSFSIPFPPQSRNGTLYW